MPEDFEPINRSTHRPSSRSNLVSATYTAIALVFFFGVGLAGGGAYKIYFSDDAAPRIATQVSPPRSLSAPPAIAPQSSAGQNFAATQPSDIEKAGPDLARIEPSAPPALAPPPAPLVPKKPGLPPPTIAPTIAPSIVQAAPPPAAAEPAPAPPDIMTATPYADTTPTPGPAPGPVLAPQAAQPETPPAKSTRVAAIPPKKPVKPATTRHATPAENKETVALHPPPTAPGNVAGPYRVQFGAFANEDNARRVQWAIEATGLNVEVSQEPGPSGHPLYFLRSPAYSDYAAALSAAQTVQHRVNGFVNAIPIDYAILGNHAVVQQQAER